MRRKTLNWAAPALCVFVTSAMTACNMGRNIPAEEDSAGKTIMALSADMSAPGDVVAFRYTITRVPCGGESFEPFQHQSEVPLMGFTLVGGTPGFDWSPVAEGADHFFSDLFLHVESGCYDISAQPITEARADSIDCYASSLDRVFMQQGKVNEVTLISQCNGDSELTYADIGVVINFPPWFKFVQYDPGKHVPKCQEQTICVTAKDPENDPLQFEWVISSGDPVASGPTLVSHTPNADGSITECQKILPGTAGGREITVKVFDMMIDPVTGGLIRYEDHFTNIGDPKPSHGEYVVPSYAHEAPLICDGGSGSSSSSSGMGGAGGAGGGNCIPGTIVSQYCQGYDLYLTLQDASCNTFQQLQLCSSSCSPPSLGTLQNTYCSGVDLYGMYANGACGTYDQLVAADSPQCGGDGCVNPRPAGTFISEFCVGYDLVAALHDGNCGTYQSVVATCSQTCGAPLAGTILSQYCSGVELYGFVADGLCGSFLQLLQSISPQCGGAWCGDGLCNGAETCSSCPSDCGACPPAGCQTTCYNAWINGNDHDVYQECVATGGYNLYLCKNALGCQDYPDGCMFYQFVP